MPIKEKSIPPPVPAKKKTILSDFYAEEMGLEEAAEATRASFNVSAQQADTLKQQPEGSDVVTETESLRHYVSTSDSMTQNTSDGQTQNESDRLTQNESVRHNVSTSDRQINKRPGGGVTRAQEPVLKWLDERCGTSGSIVTYKMIRLALNITERAARTHMNALAQKDFIQSSLATHPGSFQPIGRHIIVNPQARIALALVQQNCSDVLTQNESVRQNVSTSDGQTQNETVRQYVSTSERHTLCSSGILTTTTGGAPTENFDEKFDQLILDDWALYGLRAASIQTHLGKPLALLQDLLDKTAYVIRQKEGTDKKIQSKIGFLKTNLEREFCDTDDAFVTREESIRKQKTEQLKRETARIKEAREAERAAAIELLEVQLSEEEILLVREQAITQIRKEMQQPHLNPSEALVNSYEKNILASMAKERSLF